MLPPWLDSFQPCYSWLSTWVRREGVGNEITARAEGKQVDQDAGPEVTPSCPFLWESSL